MNKKINIVQFVPYFPPHMGGLEKNVADWSREWVKLGYGDVTIITTSLNQQKKSYKKDGYNVIVIPSFDIIKGYPMYKIWKKDFWNIIKFFKKQKPDIIQTHTRFFLTTIIGGIIANKLKIKRYHIDYGSDFTKLSSKIKEIISYLYDISIGKFVLKKINKISCVSMASQTFIKKLSKRNDINIGYMGIDLTYPEKEKGFIDLKKEFPNKIIIGFLGRIINWKNVEGLIKGYNNLSKELKNITKLVIVGNGEDYNRIKNTKEYNNIYFTGGVSYLHSLYLQNQFDIHIHSSHKGGGLATTLLQAMYLGCLIVSTPYEGANEVITNGENGILLKDSSIYELQKGIEKGINILGNNEIIKKFIKENKEIIKNKFERKNSIKKYYDLYKNNIK